MDHSLEISLRMEIPIFWSEVNFCLKPIGLVSWPSIQGVIEKNETTQKGTTNSQGLFELYGFLGKPEWTSRLATYSAQYGTPHLGFWHESLFQLTEALRTAKKNVSLQWIQKNWDWAISQRQRQYIYKRTNRIFLPLHIFLKMTTNINWVIFLYWSGQFTNKEIEVKIHQVFVSILSMILIGFNKEWNKLITNY